MSALSSVAAIVLCTLLYGGVAYAVRAHVRGGSVTWASRTWTALGERLGLRHSDAALEGTIDDFAVRIRRGVSLGGKSTSAWTLVTINGGLPADVGVVRRRWFFRPDEASRPTGVPALDRVACCSGRVEVLRALGPDGSRGLVEAVRAGWKLRRGALELSLVGELVDDLGPAVAQALIAARALRDLGSASGSRQG